MGQFINFDCNTWKVSRPSPQCYFMAAHKSRPSSTTVEATTAIKINTALANTVIAACLPFEERQDFGMHGSKSLLWQHVILCNQRIKVG